MARALVSATLRKTPLHYFTCRAWTSKSLYFWHWETTVTLSLAIQTPACGGCLRYRRLESSCYLLLRVHRWAWQPVTGHAERLEDTLLNKWCASLRHRSRQPTTEPRGSAQCPGDYRCAADAFSLSSLNFHRTCNDLYSTSCMFVCTFDSLCF